jgi:hypothetical protein
MGWVVTALALVGGLCILQAIVLALCAVMM